MSKLAIIGAIVVEPGARDEVFTAAMAHRERCLQNEPGTLAFEVLLPVEDATQLLFYELYTDPSAFDAHMKGESMAQLQAEVGPKVVSLTAIPCTPGVED